jgi:hypothetical protein
MIARHPVFAPLHTERLTIRVPRHRDAPHIAHHLNDIVIVGTTTVQINIDYLEV